MSTRRLGTDAPQKARLDQVELHGQTYEAGSTVSISGVAGEFKIRHFSEDGQEVEVFGGLPNRGMIRSFKTDRIAPPTGSAAAVEARERELAPDAIREAIAAHGRVEVPLKDADDPVERKKTSNLVFNRAYSLGLKGKFTVRVVDGVVIGERKEETNDDGDGTPA